MHTQEQVSFSAAIKLCTTPSCVGLSVHGTVAAEASTVYAE